MILKGVKPQTQLKIDALLFGLLGLVMLSALMEHTRAQESAHVRFMWHVLHGISGISMCLVLTVHLLVHLPWIRSQLARLVGKCQGIVIRGPQ